MAYKYDLDYDEYEAAIALAPEEQKDDSWKKYPHTLAARIIPDWENYPHIVYWSMKLYEAIENAQKDFEEEAIRNFMLSAPPRHGKSWLCMLVLPIWYIENYPDRHIMIATHTQALSESFSAEVRRYIEMNYDKLDVRLDKTSRAKDFFKTSQGGSIMATSIGGKGQGRPVHLAIIDDLYKNWKQVISDAYKEELDNWCKAVMGTRLEKNASIVFSCTRWSNGDQLAKIEKRAKEDPEYDQFIVINSPAILEDESPEFDFYMHKKSYQVLKLKKGEVPKNPHLFQRVYDEMGRQLGQELCKERKGLRELKTIKKRVGLQAWHALYQGKPLSDYGKLVHKDWVNYFKTKSDKYVLVENGEEIRSIPIRACLHIQVIDSAIEEKQAADRSALVTFAITPENEVLIVDVWADRIQGHKIWEKAKAKKKEFRWPGEPSYIDKQFIEDTQGGKIARFQAAEHGLTILPITPGHDDKKIRAGSISIKYQNGEVYHLLDAHWGHDALEEVLNFPDHPTDDIFDCIAYIGLMMNSDSQWEEDSGIPYYGVLNGGVSDILEINYEPEKKERSPERDGYSYVTKPSPMSGYELGGN